MELQQPEKACQIVFIEIPSIIRADPVDYKTAKLNPNKWPKFLKTGGYVAVSEVSWFTEKPLPRSMSFGWMLIRK